MSSVCPDQHTVPTPGLTLFLSQPISPSLTPFISFILREMSDISFYSAHFYILTAIKVLTALVMRFESDVLEQGKCSCEVCHTWRPTGNQRVLGSLNPFSFADMEGQSGSCCQSRR